MDLREEAVKIAVPKSKIPIRRKLIKVASAPPTPSPVAVVVAKVVSLI